MIINNEYENPETFCFGPVLKGYCIKPEFCKEMLERGLKTNISHGESLAGIIDTENRYTDEDRQFFIDNLSDVLTDYRKTQNSMMKQIDDEKTTPTYRLDSLWINIMKNYETNPSHTHHGDLSFVMYLQIVTLLYPGEQ